MDRLGTSSVEPEKRMSPFFQKLVSAAVIALVLVAPAFLYG
jgi:hypothetical protein